MRVDCFGLDPRLYNLLLLNERRKLGLLRLRGIPGQAIGRALLLAIGLGGLAGGILGALLGTAVPLMDVTSYTIDAFHTSYVVTPDGRGFIFGSPVRSAQGTREVRVVRATNWFRDLRTRMTQ